MKITAKYPTEINGYGIIKRGITIDLPEGLIDERIQANFTKDNGEPIVFSVSAKASKTPVESVADREEQTIAKAIQSLGRDGLMRKLDDMGITYKPSHRNDYLAKLYLSAVGEID